MSFSVVVVYPLVSVAVFITERVCSRNQNEERTILSSTKINYTKNVFESLLYVTIISRSDYNRIEFAWLDYFVHLLCPFCSLQVFRHHPTYRFFVEHQFCTTKMTAIHTKQNKNANIFSVRSPPMAYVPIQYHVPYVLMNGWYYWILWWRQ